MATAKTAADINRYRAKPASLQQTDVFNKQTQHVSKLSDFSKGVWPRSALRAEFTRRHQRVQIHHSCFIKLIKFLLMMQQLLKSLDL